MAEFYGLDAQLVVKALSLLEAQGKAAIIPADDADEIGVKFVPA